MLTDGAKVAFESAPSATCPSLDLSSLSFLILFVGNKIAVRLGADAGATAEGRSSSNSRSVSGIVKARRIAGGIQHSKKVPLVVGQQSPSSSRVAHPGLLEHEASNILVAKLLSVSLGVIVGASLAITDNELGLPVTVKVTTSLGVDSVARSLGVIVTTFLATLVSLQQNKKTLLFF